MTSERRLSVVRTLLFSLLSLIAGCGPYIQEVNEQHRGAVEAKLPELQRVGTVLAKTPPLEGAMATTAKLSLSLDYFPRETDNAAIIYAEDFASLDELGLVKNRLAHAQLVSECSAALHTERYPWDPLTPDKPPGGITGSRARRVYAVCVRLDYLVVIRTRAFAPVSADLSPPTGAGSASAGDAGTVAAAGADAGTADARSSSVTRSFSGGYLDAEALIFDVRAARLIGGFRFEAQSSPTLQAARSEKVAKSELERDFTRRILAALKDGFAKHAPQSDFSAEGS